MTAVADQPNVSGGRKKIKPLKGNGPMDDPNDPIYHDVPDAERGGKGIMARHARNQARLDEVHGQRLHCEHGCYVGHNRALAYRCPRCPEGQAANGSA